MLEMLYRQCWIVFDNIFHRVCIMCELCSKSDRFPVFQDDWITVFSIDLHWQGKHFFYQLEKMMLEKACDNVSFFK